MVHVDQPSEAEIQEREAELQQELLEPKECGGCDLMRPQAGDTLIYDDVMCLIEPAPWRDLDPNLGEFPNLRHAEFEVNHSLPVPVESN